MKIAYCSDLHLEFGDIALENENNADVLILAGDILVTEHLRRYMKRSHAGSGISVTRKLEIASRYRSFFDKISQKFQHIVVVAGNHEFYFGVWDEDVDFLREFYQTYGNIHFLEMDHVILEGVTFTGGTLWTDCNNGDIHTICEMTIRMRDYNVINSDRNRNGTITPDDTRGQHYATREYLEKILKKKLTNKYVVVGHHAPSPLSNRRRLKKHACVNGAYSTDLSEFIIANPHIAYWVHGHVHQPADYRIGNSRIVCNPRGYIGYQEIADVFRLKYINI